MESFITTFHIDWKIIIAQAINFIIVFFILYFLALKPLKKLMAERTENIEKGLTDAKTNSELLSKTKKEYDDVLVKAKKEAHDIFQEGKKEAESKKAEMLENANKEVEGMVLNGKKLLEAEKVKMIEEAKKEIVSLVIKATEKLLDGEENKSFDEKTLSNIKKI
jgi:F-type H+-transporting ATPase subunit b